MPSRHQNLLVIVTYERENGASGGTEAATAAVRVARKVLAAYT